MVPAYPCDMMYTLHPTPPSRAGFVLDERGFKMSKSIGNVVDPRTVMLGGTDQKAEPPYGADVLRLWVASVDSIGSDVSIGPQILEQVNPSPKPYIRLPPYTVPGTRRNHGTGI